MGMVSFYPLQSKRQKAATQNHEHITTCKAIQSTYIKKTVDITSVQLYMSLKKKKKVGMGY